MTYEFTTTTFVHLATAAQVLGFLVTKQLILRILVLVGSGFYIVYYYMHLGEPQWDAIIGSSLIGLANLFGLALLLHSRLPIGMKPEDRRVFDSLGGLEPGQFRRLMKIGTLVHATEPVQLTSDGVVPEHLYFVMDGKPLIVKDAHTFRIQDNCFVGEVAFKLGCGASATVSLPEGGRYVSWARRDLEALLTRAPVLGQAFDALIARDMATKVALSAPVRGDTVGNGSSPVALAFGLEMAV